MTNQERFTEILHLVDAAARLIHRHEATDAGPVLLLLRVATDEARFGAEFAAQEHERRDVMRDGQASNEVDLWAQ